MVHFPPPLKPGATIGVVAPARWPKPEWLIRGKAFLEKHGYKVVIHPQNCLKNGQLAGTDEKRAAAIMDMFRDPKIGAIMCSRGGTGAIRLLDKLDYTTIKRHPKPFIGFSDITLLLQAINKRCGFVTYHGPMLWNFANPHNFRTAEDLFAALKGKMKGLRLPQVVGAQKGSAEGVLVGGNISLLEHLMGTAYDWSAKGAILLLEDVDEPIYKIDSKLAHMRLAGKFEGVKAIIVGDMVNISDGESGRPRKGDRSYGRSLREVFFDNVPRHVPLGFDFPCGHGKYLTTLPIGARIKVDIGKRGAKISF